MIEKEVKESKEEAEKKAVEAKAEPKEKKAAESKASAGSTGRAKPKDAKPKAKAAKKEAKEEKESKKPAAKEEKPKPKPKKKKKIKGPEVIKAKKKKAVARSTIRKGNGKVRVNKIALEAFEPRYVREYMKEGLIIYGKEPDFNIDVKVAGGGIMSQAGAARGCIAKSILLYTGDEELRKKYLAYDRSLLVDDSRRTEPKKPLGRKPRAKKQLSRR